MNKELSFEKLVQEANKPYSDIIDRLTPDEQKDVELIQMTDELLAVSTQLWLKTPTRVTAQCLTPEDMPNYFDSNTSDAFKQRVKRHLVGCPRCFDKLTDYHQKIREHLSWEMLVRYFISSNKVSTKDRAHIEACEYCQSGAANLVIKLDHKPKELMMAAAGDDNNTLAEFGLRLEGDIICSAVIWRQPQELKPDHLILKLDLDPTRLKVPKNLIGRTIRVNLKGINQLEEEVKRNEVLKGKVDKRGIVLVDLGVLCSQATNQKLREKFDKIDLEIGLEDNGHPPAES